MNINITIRNITKLPHSVITLRGAYFSILIALFFILSSSTVSAITSVNTSNKNVVTNGLVGHWTFDGKDTNWTTFATGTTRDLSRNGYTGTFVNTNRTTASKLGKIGQGLFLTSATTERLLLGADKNPIVTNDYSISFWVYPTKALSSVSSTPFVSNYNGYGDSAISITDNGYELQFWGEPGETAIAAPELAPNKWYFITGTRNSVTGLMNLYNNGVLVSSSIKTAGPLVYVFNGRWSFGQDYNIPFGGGSAGCGCIIDEVRIYNRVISDKEIQTLYKAGGGTTQSSVSNTKTNTNSVGISNGLVGHWTFDGKDTTWTTLATGTTRDISGNNKTGTLTNMNRLTVSKLGKIGQGLNFDGVNDSVTAINVSVREYTLSFWTKRENLGVNGYNSVFACTATTGAGYYGWYDTGFVRWCYTDGTGFVSSKIPSGVIAPTSNKWVHVVMTVTASGTDVVMKEYFDGRVAVTDTANTGLGTTTFTTIGNGHLYFKGSLDDVRIYNRALSLKEIQTLYKLGQTAVNITPTVNISGISSGLIGHWTFDGKDTNWNASTTYNRGSNANNGTLVGLSATTSPRLGKIGQGLFFKRLATTTVSVGSNPPLTDDFSVSFWTYPTVSENPVIFFSNNNGYSGSRVVIDDSTFNLRFYAGTSSQDVFAPKLTPNKWYHIVAVRNSSTGVLSIYNNGIIVGTSSPGLSLGTITYGSNGLLAIGGQVGTGSAPANGCGCVMDDVRVYNRVISEKEIQALYKLGSR